MRKIAIVTQKGGAGKSTLAMCLAVAAREAGERVFILDLDPIRSLVGWGERREGGDIPVMAAPARKLRKIMTRLEMLGVTLAIVDTPAGEGDAAEFAMDEAQFCLVPARPNVFDVCASETTLKKLKSRKRDYAFVLNQCPPQRHGPRVRQGVEQLAAMGALLTPLVAARADYQDAARKGLGVTELNPAGAAASEMRDLWRAVRARLEGVAAGHETHAA
jgi:chromosome partitioning protein